jgi:hypothetical protein
MLGNIFIIVIFNVSVVNSFAGLNDFCDRKTLFFLVRSIYFLNILMCCTANMIICFNFLAPFCSLIVHNKNRNTLHCVHDDNDKLNATQLVARPTLIYFLSAKKHYCVIFPKLFFVSPQLSFGTN